MKKLSFILIAFFVFASTVFAQPNPVSWNFSTKKISEKVYEVHCVATINSGWHIYSQNQPKDAIALPTEFNFTANPLISLDGQVKEIGKLEKFYDKSIQTSAHQYSNTVKFVQKITLKTNVKTTLVGTVQYQTCDDSKCLPPKKVPFTVNVG
jgi:thiol:disulfide interchange protein DsbD